MARPSTVRCRMTATIAETASQTNSAFGIPRMCSGRKRAHEIGGRGLGREAAGIGDHQSAHDRVDAKREDHRGHAKIGDAEAVDEADHEADRETDRDRPGAADRGRHHRGRGQRPGNGKVDLRDQDDDHHPGRDDPEEGADLQLLQEIVRRQQRRAAKSLPGVSRAGDEDRDDEQRRDQDRPVVARRLEDGRKARSPEELQRVLHPQHA